MFEPILIPFEIALLIFFSWVIYHIFKFKLYKDINNRENVRYIFELLSFPVSIAAIVLSIYTLTQSDKDRKQSDTDRIAQENRYNEQRKKDSLQQIILGSSKDFLKSMDSSFISLNSNVNNITGKLENVPDQINDISKSFQSLNSINQKQYSIIFQQYDYAQKQIAEKKEADYRESLKRPLISIKAIECDKTFSLTNLYIANDGNLSAVVPWLTLEITDLVSSDELVLDNVKAERTLKDNYIRFKIFNIGELKEKETKPFKISWRIINGLTDSLYAHYKLFYKSANISDTINGSVMICNQIE